MYINTCNNVLRLVQKTTFSLPRSYRMQEQVNFEIVDNNMGSSIKNALPCLHLHRWLEPTSNGKNNDFGEKTYINDHGQVKEAYIQLACFLSVKFFFNLLRRRYSPSLQYFRRTAQWFCYVMLIPRDMYSMSAKLPECTLQQTRYLSMTHRVMHKAANNK